MCIKISDAKFISFIQHCLFSGNFLKSGNFEKKGSIKKKKNNYMF